MKIQCLRSLPRGGGARTLLNRSKTTYISSLNDLKYYMIMGLPKLIKIDFLINIYIKFIALMKLLLHFSMVTSFKM
jgi:hypothetical protein